MKRDLVLLAIGACFGATLGVTLLSPPGAHVAPPIVMSALAALWLWLDRRHRHVRVVRTLDALGLEWDGAGHAAVVRGTWEFRRWGDRWEAVCLDAGVATSSFWVPAEVARWLEGKRSTRGDARR